MSGKERRGRRASNIRGAGKKLEFSRVVVAEQERERAQRPAIVSLRLLLVNGGSKSCGRQ